MTDPIEGNDLSKISSPDRTTDLQSRMCKREDFPDNVEFLLQYLFTTLS